MARLVIETDLRSKNLLEITNKIQNNVDPVIFVIVSCYTHFHLGRIKRKNFEPAQNAQSQINLRLLVTCSPFVHSVVSNDSVSRQRRPRSV